MVFGADKIIMLNMDNKPSADSIPFLLFMEEQEELQRQQLLKEDTNRRDREQSEDNFQNSFKSDLRRF
jgi:hypothetical protein